MVNPVEGVDYIIDRYALLGLKPNATSDEIDKAITRRNVENHPDTLARASAEIKSAAERARELTRKCDEVLRIPAKKANYDKRLEWFQANHPELISTDGIAIISSRRFHVDLDMLINGQTIDQTQTLTLIDSLTAAGSARNVTMLERMYRLNPNDAELKASYREALVTRLTALSEKEKLAWEAAGICGGPKEDTMLIDAEDYNRTVMGQIENMRKNVIPETVEQRSIALLAGTGTPLLLPSPSDNNALPKELGSALSQEERAAILAKADETFSQRTNRLKQLAEEKQSLLLKILDLSEPHDLAPSLKDTGHTQIFLMIKNKANAEPVVVLAQSMDNATFNGQTLEGFNGKTLSEMKNAGLKDESYAVEIEPELVAHGYVLTHISHLFKKVRGLSQDAQQSLQ